ncbi:MAG: acyltransferase domain-containing protein [Verrucomicrobia bacterium]|nr:acyltransferase domain-containing protein [Verrucomicrobiota bacterium]
MFDLTGQQPEAQRVFEAARAVLDGKDPRQLVREADPATLYSNRVGQVLCCSQALAGWTLIQRHLSRPVIIAGYSVGELAAWGCAGLLTPEEVLRLAVLRAEVMDAAGNGNTGLAAIRGLGRARLESICHPHDVHIAIVNSGDLFIVGGVRDALSRVCDAALKAGAARAGMLHVAVAAHTPLLAEASRRFGAALAQLNLPLHSPADVRLLTGIDGEVVFDPPAGAGKLAQQISRTVDWAACLDACRATGAKTVLELGPGRALANLAREVLTDAQVRSVEDFRTPEGVVKWVPGAG